MSTWLLSKYNKTIPLLYKGNKRYNVAMKKFFSFLTVFSLFCGLHAQSVQPQVTRFDTSIQNNSVIITWSTEDNADNMILYRSLNPFTQLSSLADAVLLATFRKGTRSYTDYPLANTNYYYALVLECQITTGELQFLPGKNTIASAVRIVAETEESQLSERAMTVPLLSNTEAPNHNAARFSTDTEKKIAALQNNFSKYPDYLQELDEKKETVFTQFFRFPEECPETVNVNSLSLKKILDTCVEAEDWSQLQNGLSQFLRLTHPKGVTARALFYLGEAYFFQKVYDKALLTFLQVEDTYPEAKPWVHCCLEKLAQ